MARFNLPVLKGGGGAATPEDLLRRALHAEQEYGMGLGEAVDLECGVALVSAEFSQMSEANQVREVVVPDGGVVLAVVGEVEGAFAGRGVRCYQWVCAEGRNPPALVEALKQKGYHERRAELWVLGKPRNLAVWPEVMVIPARASFAKLAELAEGAERGWGTTDEVELSQYGPAAVRQLDDSRVDGLLALQGERGVGTLNLMTVGEMGVIMDLYVRPGCERRGVATSLLAHVIELAGRSRLRYLTLFCNVQNAAARALYAKVGFATVAEAESMTLEAAD